MNRVQESAQAASIGIGTISLATAEIIPILESKPIEGVDLFGIGAGAERATRILKSKLPPNLEAAANEGAGKFSQAFENFGGWKGMFTGISAAVSAFSTGGWKAGLSSMVQSALALLPPGMAQVAQAAFAAMQAAWGGLKRLLGGPSEAELAARETFAAYLETASTELSKLPEYQAEVQRAMRDGWPETTASMRAVFITFGQQAGKTYDEAFQLYTDYQAALQAGDSERMEQIQEQLSGQVAATKEAVAAINAERERILDTALSAYQSATEAADAAYKAAYDAAIKEGAAVEAAVERGQAAAAQGAR